MNTELNYEHISMAEAKQIQQDLREQVDITEQSFEVKYIGGADISLNLYSPVIYAGIILLSYPQLKPVAYSLVRSETRFPYVPGYLAFREVPALLTAWKQMLQKPDVLVVDGHGIAHPRRMGIATHFGVLSGQRSMGCAKNLLYGHYQEPGLLKGDYSAIQGTGNEVIGFAYRSKNKTAPVYVSPGHLMGLQNTLETIRHCTGQYRIPEPTRLAHELVNRFRKGELEAGYDEL